ncbi:unnamed protein product [Brachionus calyciflorus]|uniref:palmitoyl-protein hydrolase n=1 Tax=Brachionus calyciflorus TaxID=104777 RepID=A0A813VQ26_9BILA|nr:unnamed protein product [Brachionus calyciflorus]
MNGLSVGELCCLFCCPPFPSQIVAKLAFLPPPPTYSLIVNSDQTYPLNEQSNLQMGQNQQQNNPNANASNRANRNSSGFSNFIELIRNSGRRLCSSMVCAQQSYPHQTGQLTSQVVTNAKIVMKEKAEWQYGPGELEKLEVFLTRTERGHQIACLFVRCTPNPKYTILFSHGNAVDIGQMSSFYYGLGSRLDCNIFTYDYSGYGASGGTPNEKNLYADIRAAWNALRCRFGISPSNIILYGQSIGTVPTVDLASKYDCAGVILHAPLMSGMRVAFNTTRTWCCDAFPSIDKVSKISSIVLVIHGTEDEVIDLSHGIAIHEKCPKAVDPLWVEGAGHNDIEIYAQYVERLKRFINEEIRMHQYSIMTAAHAQQVAASLAQSVQANQPNTQNEKSFTALSAPQNVKTAE